MIDVAEATVTGLRLHRQVAVALWTGEVDSVVHSHVSPRHLNVITVALIGAVFCFNASCFDPWKDVLVEHLLRDVKCGN